MRILIPILGFAPQGGYRVLSELANAWIRRGHDCTFLVPATSGEPYFPTNAQVLRCDSKGRFADSESVRRQTGYDNLMSLFAGLRRIGREYDLILANHSLTTWPVSLADCGKARKIYYIQAYEPDYYPPLRDPIKHLLARGSYFFRLRQIANTAAYQGRGLRPEAVIPPGINLSIFEPKRLDGDFLGKETITLGTIGRTEPYKGTATALAAYRLLRKSDPRLRMKVGFGNVEPSEDIEIVPIQSDVQLAAFYRSVDILIVSCRGQHGAPHYPLIEAMASGTSVVHTGYYPGDLTNSWQATDSTIEAVSGALQELFQTPADERSRRIENARRTVECNLSWDAIAVKFEEFFRD
jgi:glycosyltransferase involved in cell wall biosynthesis